MPKFRVTVAIDCGENSYHEYDCEVEAADKEWAIRQVIRKEGWNDDEYCHTSVIKIVRISS